jgi:hypothetical protein
VGTYAVEAGWGDERDVSRVVGSNAHRVRRISAAERCRVLGQLVFDPVAARLESEAEVIIAWAHVLARNPLGGSRGTSVYRCPERL